MLVYGQSWLTVAVAMVPHATRTGIPQKGSKFVGRILPGQLFHWCMYVWSVHLGSGETEDMHPTSISFIPDCLEQVHDWAHVADSIRGYGAQ